MKHYDLVVLGSGYYSVGLAVGVGNALVVDEQYLVDPVFYGTLSGFAPTPCKDFQGLEEEIGTHFAEPSFRVDERLNTVFDRDGTDELLDFVTMGAKESPFGESLLSAIEYAKGILQ